MGPTDFKASSGWFENFKKRNNITFYKICGESGSVSEEACKEWLETLPPILKENDPQNIFNADETGLFFKCLPDKTMGVKGEACPGGKKNKERLTLLICTTMEGTEKLKPFMIGKSQKVKMFCRNQVFSFRLQSK